MGVDRRVVALAAASVALLLGSIGGLVTEGGSDAAALATTTSTEASTTTTVAPTTTVPPTTAPPPTAPKRRPALTLDQQRSLANVTLPAGFERAPEGGQFGAYDIARATAAAPDPTAAKAEIEQQGFRSLYLAGWTGPSGEVVTVALTEYTTDAQAAATLADADEARSPAVPLAAPPGCVGFQVPASDPVANGRAVASIACPGGNVTVLVSDVAAPSGRAVDVAAVVSAVRARLNAR